MLKFETPAPTTDINVVLVGTEEESYPKDIEPRAHKTFIERLKTSSVQMGDCVLVFADDTKTKAIAHFVCVNENTGEINTTAFENSLCELFSNKWARNNKKSIDIPVRANEDMCYDAYLFWSSTEYPGNVYVS